jgi:hypothetical protein
MVSKVQTFFQILAPPEKVRFYGALRAAHHVRYFFYGHIFHVKKQHGGTLIVLEQP